jgi:tmRNA-binding protein
MNRYKVLDRDSNEHVIFDSFEDACIFKGVNIKSVYKVKRNTKDRPKDFKSGSLLLYATNSSIKAYVQEWLKLNKLCY